MRTLMSVLYHHHAAMKPHALTPMAPTNVPARKAMKAGIALSTLMTVHPIHARMEALALMG